MVRLRAAHAGPRMPKAVVDIGTRRTRERIACCGRRCEGITVNDCVRAGCRGQWVRRVDRARGGEPLQMGPVIGCYVWLLIYRTQVSEFIRTSVQALPTSWDDLADVTALWGHIHGRRRVPSSGRWKMLFRAVFWNAGKLISGSRAVRLFTFGEDRRVLVTCGRLVRARDAALAGVTADIVIVAL